jgi:hypothetical protein
VYSGRGRITAERREHALAPTEQQITKHWPALIINASNLAVENGAFNFEVFSNPCSEIRKAAKRISVSSRPIVPGRLRYVPTL